jgi:hypothetical protein
MFELRFPSCPWWFNQFKTLPKIQWVAARGNPVSTCTLGKHEGRGGSTSVILLVVTLPPTLKSHGSSLCPVLFRHGSR